jgi:cytochrome d ubiquinol oxidase subunit II
LNVIFELYYGVFSVFAVLLLVELMGSIYLLLFWRQAMSKVLEYILPTWEITGTFAAFVVVMGAFAYPSLLVPIAGTFASVFVIFLIFFVARNASLAFAESIIKRRWLDSAKLYRFYAVSTLILGIIVLVLLSSLVSGAGVNLTDKTFSLGSWASSSGSLLFVIGTLGIGIGLAPVFFALNSLKCIILPMTGIGIGLSILAYYLFSPSFVSSLLLIPVALTLLLGVLFVLSRKTAIIVSNKVIFITIISTAIFSLQFLVYPSAVGGAVYVDAVTTSGPMTSAYLAITAVGEIMLAIMLGFYINVAKHQKIHIRTARKNKDDKP